MANNQLKRTLGLPSLIFYGVGIILGAGIYSVIGKAAGIVGPSLWVTFLFAAVSTGLTALSYCEVATLYPETGAEYTYLRNAFPNHRRAATVIGLIMAFAGTATSAAVAVAFGGYLSDFISISPLVAAVIALFIFTIINSIGIQESSRVNTIFTVIEITGLILFIGLGFSVEHFTKTLTAPISPNILSGTALIIFAYFGFEDIVNLAEETKDPYKSLPKAILYSLLVSTILYILVSLSAISLSSAEQLNASEAPLMDSAKATSPRIAYVLGLCALFSTANTILIAMLAASRSFFGLAKENDFPSLFAKVLPKKKTPWMASLLVLVLALAITPFGGVDTLANVASLATLIGFFTVNLSVIKLRFSEPNIKRPFTVPFSIGKLPLLPVFGMLSTLILLVHFGAKTYLIAFVSIAAILILQFALSAK